MLEFRFIVILVTLTQLGWAFSSESRNNISIPIEYIKSIPCIVLKIHGVKYSLQLDVHISGIFLFSNEANTLHEYGYDCSIHLGCSSSYKNDTIRGKGIKYLEARVDIEQYSLNQMPMYIIIDTDTADQFKDVVLDGVIGIFPSESSSLGRYLSQEGIPVTFSIFSDTLVIGAYNFDGIEFDSLKWRKFDKESLFVLIDNIEVTDAKSTSLTTEQNVELEFTNEKEIMLTDILFFEFAESYLLVQSGCNKDQDGVISCEVTSLYYDDKRTLVLHPIKIEINELEYERRVNDYDYIPDFYTFKVGKAISNRIKYPLIKAIAKYALILDGDRIGIANIKTPLAESVIKYILIVIAFITYIIISIKHPEE